MNEKYDSHHQSRPLRVAAPLLPLHRNGKIGTSTSSQCKRRAFLFGGLAIASLGMMIGTSCPGNAMMTRVGPVRNVQDYREAIAFAGLNNRFAVIDVAAEWCAFCHVLDKKILVDPRISTVLAELALIRIDVTAMDPANLSLLSQLSVLGPPTLFVVDTKTGWEIENTRSVGAFDAENLLQRLRPLI